MLHPITHSEPIIAKPNGANYDAEPLFTYTPEAKRRGYALRAVEVPDISEDSAELLATTEKIGQLEALLEQNPDWKAPEHTDDWSEIMLDPNNEASNWLYGGSKGSVVHEWRRSLVPTALALETLALKQDTLPTTDIEINGHARNVFTNSMDAIAIRTRGAVMSELVAHHASTKDPNEEQKWLSLACGAARPVLEAAERVKQENGTPIDVTLVDFDTKVLDYSSSLADSMDATIRHREIDSNLLRSMVATDGLVDVLGEESMDVVDLLGFLEYCQDKYAVRMLQNSYRLTAPGGVLVTSNMRDDRPQKQFHLRGIGWPGVQMRSSDELVELAIEAGIDPAHVEAYQPTDGVYTVLKIVKPTTVQHS